MPKFYLISMGLLLVFLTSPKGVCALTPPTKERVYCRIEGEILSHQKEEASDSFMNKIEVDTITLIIHAALPVEKSDNGAFCARIAGIELQAGQTTNTFRLCDKTNASDGQSITGIVGNSEGGGRYCIEGIQPFNANSDL